MAQSVEHPTSAQVMISWLMSSSPTLGSVLMAQSLEPASDSVSHSLSVPSTLVLCLSLKNTRTLKKIKKKKRDLTIHILYARNTLNSRQRF